MANSKRNFIAGRMNKSVDERLVPNGEYIDALNVRLGSTEDSEIGSVENSKGNTVLTNIELIFPDSGGFLNGTALSSSARCIGAFEDGANETIYWFIHDSNATTTSTGKADLIVSYNTSNESTTYHILSVKNENDVTNTTLNFNPKYLINNINIVEDLLFFTDNYNPPRKININQTYREATSATGADRFSPNDILVIVQPPTSYPTVLSTVTGNPDTFMQEKFICFAYRYRYKNNEYSATSQFSNASFVPKPFSLSSDNFLNEGMINSTNGATLTYSTGPSQAVEVEILFKESASNIIKVIESIDVTNLSNNIDQVYTFEDSKIFTILSEGEILRLYDNVPLLANSQTLMGNRIMYGNYVEGYNLTRNNVATDLTYYIESESKTFGLTSITQFSVVTQEYLLAAAETSDGKVNVDLSEIPSLKKGGILTLSFTITHEDWEGQPSPSLTPSENNPPTTVIFNYSLLQDFNSVSELINSIDFQEKMGTVSNIQTVANAATGSTFTDIINNALLETLGDYTKFESGIAAANEPILVTGSSGSNALSLSVITMGYTTDISAPTSSNTFYELFRLTNIDFSYQELGNTQSLHSNRGYEVGIVYMDEFNRATTTLVSENNNLYIPCINSVNKNTIKLTIPTTQIAPDFAKTFKFVIKPDGEDYETIYSQIYFEEAGTNYTYFKLEGENIAKVEEGDRYIVKRSAIGPLASCAYATVLEKISVASGVITPKETNVTVPAGTYMKIQASDFSTSFINNTIVEPGLQSSAVARKGAPSALPYDSFEDFITTNGSSSTYSNYAIPQGSIVDIFLDIYRNKDSSIIYDCDYIYFKLDTSYVVSKDYSDIIDWFNGDNIASTFTSADVSSGVTSNYNPNTLSSFNLDDFLEDAPTNGNTRVNFRWAKSTAASNLDEIKFFIRGFDACGSNSGGARVKARFRITLSDGTVVFETEPSESLPDVWYEGQDSYPVGATGLHKSNVPGDINQTSSINGVFNLRFTNCYSFGNGVESYKIRDSINGQKLNIGNRVTTVAEQDYKRAHRANDITYSGIYNDETNLNRLNEFNLGLLNFKPLEESFGPINKLFARETDVLVLQEDKISYVLAGKNLLSDASGVSLLTSVPEVLGKQIARIEEYGISSNPESFTSYGPNKFFTDSKRGVLIQLKGSSGSSEQLNVISEVGMRGWFRDLFQESFNTQKLGAYDPYMNEYVLSNNDILIPLDDVILPCNTLKDFNLTSESSVTFTVDVGSDIGSVDVVFKPTTNVDVLGVWNGATVFSGTVNANVNSLKGFSKNIVAQNLLSITISKVTATDTPNISVIAKCPVSNPLKVATIVLTNDEKQGDSIHTKWTWTNGDTVTSSPYQVVNFTAEPQAGAPFASEYNIYDGIQGQGIIPIDSCDMTMNTFKFRTDNYDVNSGKSVDKFKWLVSASTYDNTPAGLSALITAIDSAGAAHSITPTGPSPSFSSSFNVGTITGNDKTLFLVWDFRAPNTSLLCYNSDVTASGLEEICCNCQCPSGNTSTYKITNAGNTTITITYSGGTQVLQGQSFVNLASTTYPSYVPINAPSIAIDVIACT